MVLLLLMAFCTFSVAEAKTKTKSKHKRHRVHRRHAHKKVVKSKEELELEALPPFLAVDSSQHQEMNTLTYLLTIFSRQLGKPYGRGANGPESYDCSGLVKFAFSFIGVELPRTAADIGETGTPVDLDSVKQGDLLFFTGSRFSLRKRPGHVGCVYKVDSTGVYMIHSSEEGVNIANITTSAYYRRRFLFSKRILNHGPDSATAQKAMTTN